jgi:asparagine synthase (glutamine-hydrolysing)
MCGICGIFNYTTARPAEAGVLGAMNDALVHRGPDEAGCLLDGEVGVAMRRLSIIDLAGGTQPIWNEDRTIAVVNNGEIYNFRELTTELTAAGHRFRTRSDTEVIVHAYEEWGLDAPTHLRGMFAFAVWDGRRRRLVVARDRLGIKPLFYAFTPDGVVFASEIKSILATGFPKTLDRIALDQYLSHFCVPTPRTIFQGIRRLPPGHSLVCEQRGAELREYWDLDYAPEPFAGDDTEYVEQVRSHLSAAVQRHLQSDVPLGAFLSGGLDSGAVVAAMSTMIDEPVHTFTVGFDEPTYDERPAARLIAEQFATRHSERTIAPDWRDLLPRLARIFDEPFGDYASIAGYFVSEWARRDVKVVLSGDGGDEIFAGYPTHYAHKVARLYRRVPALVRRQLIAPLVGRLPASTDRVPFEYRAKRFVAGAELPFQEGHLHWKVIFSEAEKACLLSSRFQESRDAEGAGFAVFDRHFKKVAHLDPLSQLLYVDAKTFLLDDNLTRVDRTSMAHGLEVRVPLLDDELVELLRRMPLRAKQPAWGTKHLLRRALDGVLPASIVRGKKKGFTPPMPRWLQTGLKDLMLDTLAPARVARLGLLNEHYVSDLVQQHLNGQHDHNRKLWALMSLMVWWDEYQPV